MDDKEKIKVYIRIVHGKTVCICPRGNKLCERSCETDEVTRDKYAGWLSVYHRDKYGR